MPFTPAFARPQPRNPAHEILTRLTGVADDVRSLDHQLAALGEPDFPAAPAAREVTPVKSADNPRAIAPTSKTEGAPPPSAGLAPEIPANAPAELASGGMGAPASIHADRSPVPETGVAFAPPPATRFKPVAPPDVAPLVAAVAQEHAATLRAFHQLLALHQTQAREMEWLRREVQTLAARVTHRY